MGGMQTDIDEIPSVAAAVGEVDGVLSVTAGEDAGDGSDTD